MPVNSVRILAHRGGMARAPENTLESFRRAAAEGADAVECDVRLSRDGEPVVFHDDDAFRLTGRRAEISNMGWNEIKEFRIRGRDPIPHLDDVLRFATDWPSGQVYFDLHQDNLKLVEVLTEKILSAGLWERSFVLDFYSRRRLLLHARSLDSRIRLAIMPQEPWHVGPSVEKLGIKTLCLGWDGSLTRFLYKSSCLFYDAKSAIARASKMGACVSAGVANNEEDVRYVLEQGATGVWTDDVPLARRVISGVLATRPSSGSSREDRPSSPESPEGRSP